MLLRAKQVSMDAGNKATSEIQKEKYSHWNQNWHLVFWWILRAEVRLKFSAGPITELKTIISNNLVKTIAIV